MDLRAAAKEASRELTNIRHEQGDEAYHTAIQERLGSSSDETYKAALFGAFAAEFERVVEIKPVVSDRLPPDLLHRPYGPRDGSNFMKAAQEVITSLAPSEDFFQAVRADSRTPTYLLGTSAPEDAVRNGHGTFVLFGSGLVPITAAVLHKNGVTSRDGLIDATRTNGCRLVTGLALSQDRLSNFMTYLKYKNEGMYSEYMRQPEWFAKIYNQSDYLADDFRPVFTTEFREGQPYVTWNGEDTVDVGCPITLMSRNMLKPAWNAVLDLTVQAGYFDRFPE
jgi:hypothetical protein